MNCSTCDRPGCSDQCHEARHRQRITALTRDARETILRASTQLKMVELCGKLIEAKADTVGLESDILFVAGLRDDDEFDWTEDHLNLIGDAFANEHVAALARRVLPIKLQVLVGLEDDIVEAFSRAARKAVASGSAQERSDLRAQMEEYFEGVFAG